jgi:hypothetical protein
MRHRLSHFPHQELDSDWLNTVIAVGKMEEVFLAEEKLLRDFREEAKPKNQLKSENTAKEASKWKAVKTENPSRKMEKKKGLKDRDNLTEAEKEEKEKLLKGMLVDLRSFRYKARVCIQCGIKGHGQYECPAPKPVISSTNLKRKQSDSLEVKEEPVKKKGNVVALTTKAGRIWEVNDSDAEMEE